MTNKEKKPVSNGNKGRKSQNNYSRYTKSKQSGKSTRHSITKNKGNRGKTRKNTNHKPLETPSVKIAFLGGLNEIGKNITLFECCGDMFILDCGMAFPDGEMLGVDLVLPDFSYIKENINRIKGIVITHGHEDHIGGLPYLLKDCNIPVYGTALSMGLVGNKLKEHNLMKSTKRKVIKYGQSINLGCFRIEFMINEFR